MQVAALLAVLGEQTAQLVELCVHLGEPPGPVFTGRAVRGLGALQRRDLIANRLDAVITLPGLDHRGLPRAARSLHPTRRA